MTPYSLWVWYEDPKNKNKCYGIIYHFPCDLPWTYGPLSVSKILEDLYPQKPYRWFPLVQPDPELLSKDLRYVQKSERRGFEFWLGQDNWCHVSVSQNVMDSLEKRLSLERCRSFP